VINSNRILRQAGLAAAIVISVFSLAGCGKGAAGKTADAEKLAPMLIAPEDVLTVSSNAMATGPSITGSIEPERRADLRAEVSAVVLAVLKENGDPVKRGDLLVRLDQTSIRDSLTAADASARAADQAFEQAERQYQRMATLKQTGVVSTQQLEDVEIRRNSAQSDRAAAHTRVVTARQQLERTEVRAPFNGIVSDRKVSAGDTAAVGKELLKVIDPASLRFEGLVSADSVGPVEGRPARVVQDPWLLHQRIHGRDHARESGRQHHYAPGRSPRGLRRREQAAERRRPLCRGSRGNSKQRNIESSRRIHRARGRQRICVARER
jgi:multidrug efflux pump subunit AcrA (membrane-fusion protein)